MTETYATCGICSTLTVVHPACSGRGCEDRDCKSGHVCPKCCERPSEALRGSGWSPKTAMVALKPWKEMVRSAIDAALAARDPRDWVPTPLTNGRVVMRDAWAEGWHLGISEGPTADGGVYFRGVAEREDRGIKVRLPSAWVDRIRQACFPGLPGKSE